MASTDIDVATPRGPAMLRLDRPTRRGRALLALGHGAGGGIDAADLVAVRDAALAAGLAVARVTQPYRVAGRRSPAPAAALDEAWVAAVEHAHRRVGAGLALVVGGRSAGARVACRTARRLGAVAVVALAFPLHPPGRPEQSRASELDEGLATLVVNGDRDPFGAPSPRGLIEVVLRPGERHDLRRDPAAVGQIVLDWLAGVLGLPARSTG